MPGWTSWRRLIVASAVSIWASGSLASEPDVAQAEVLTRAADKAPTAAPDARFLAFLGDAVLGADGIAIDALDMVEIADPEGGGPGVDARVPAVPPPVDSDTAERTQ